MYLKKRTLKIHVVIVNPYTIFRDFPVNRNLKNTGASGNTGSDTGK